MRKPTALDSPPQESRPARVNQSLPIPDPQLAEMPARLPWPLLIILYGRSKNGKSLFAGYVAGRALEAGLPLLLCDCDRDNDSLSSQFNNEEFRHLIRRPRASTTDHYYEFFKKLSFEMAETRMDAIIDMGFGGAREFREFVKNNYFLDALKELRIRPVLVLPLAPDVEDLKPIQTLLKVFKPDNILIVLNQGLLATGADLMLEYQEFLANPQAAFLKTLNPEPEYLHMPRMPGATKMQNCGKPVRWAGRRDWGEDVNPLNLYERLGAAEFCNEFDRALDEKRHILPCPRP